MKSAMLPLIVGLLSIATLVASQSNYALQAIDVPYEEGLPPTATLAGKVTELDSLQPEIHLNRTMAILNCASGSMHVELKFKRPFYGIAYADFDRNSACYAQGTGDLVVTLELPLKGCGTKQDPKRVFTNNVIVRFHPGLEMEGDEVITVVCRYPPPIVPLPPQPIILPSAPAAVLPRPTEFQILMIICTLLFLGLMLLGLGCSYYCLKHRNIQVVRKRPFTPEEEESEKLSTIESLTVKIPRVHAPSTNSSEVPVEEPFGSDYPSSIEEPPPRPETVSSEYSDTHAQIETQTVIPPARLQKPRFDVNLRVAQQPLETVPASDLEGSISSVEQGVARSSHVPELHPPPRRGPPPPPVFKQAQDIHRPQRSVLETETVDHLTIIDREDIDRETRYAMPIAERKPEVSVHTVDDVYLQTIVEKKLIEDEERRTREVTQFYKKDEPKWDVTITNHPREPSDIWERGSETTEVSSVGWSTVEETPIQPHYSTVVRDHLNRRTEVTREDLERQTTSRSMDILHRDEQMQRLTEKWRVLFRVLESPQLVSNANNMGTQDFDDARSDTTSVLTEDDREKWRQIITTESTLRTLLTEAKYREDYERIRQDTRYMRLFEPEKWDVIIRVLSEPPSFTGDSQDRMYSDSTSEVSSASSSHPLTRAGGRMFRKKSSDTTATSAKSVTDVRSMTEVMVDFGVTRGDDESSVASSGIAPRSTADRSSTEIVEFAPLEDDFEDENVEETSHNYSSQLQSHHRTASGHFQEEQIASSSTFVQRSSTSASKSSSYSSRTPKKY